MSTHPNQDRMAPAPFCNGYRAYVCVGHMWMNRTARKLAEKKVGFAPIISQPSAMSFTIRLPSTIRIHPVFYMSELKPDDPITFEDRNQQPPPPLTVDGQPEYLIERIIDSKCKRVRRKCQLQYHVKWVDYPISNNPSDWILADAFDDPARQALTTAYHTQHSNKPGLEALAKGWGRWMTA